MAYLSLPFSRDAGKKFFGNASMAQRFSSLMVSVYILISVDRELAKRFFDAEGMCLMVGARSSKMSFNGVFGTCRGSWSGVLVARWMLDWFPNGSIRKKKVRCALDSGCC